MPAVIDVPANAGSADPEYLWVQGWVWLGENQPNITTVEAWVVDSLIGATSAFYIRPDVAQALSIPSGTHLGFTIPPRKIPVCEAACMIHISVVLRDGSRLDKLAMAEFLPRADPTAPLHLLRAGIPRNARGLEIGAHSQPVPFLSPFYTDSVKTYAGSEGHVDFLADACYLPLPDDTLDYLCSSHVLEHLPNPLGALYEWHRVLKPGGWLYLVVPDKRFTFDRSRPLTSINHLLNDFLMGTYLCSDEHLTEFVYEADWATLRPDGPPEEVANAKRITLEDYRRRLAQGEHIDIHYHTFTPESLEKLLLVAGLAGDRSGYFEIVGRAERYLPDRGDGICFLLRKRHGNRERPEPQTFKIPHPDPAISPLCVVCPCSLGALEPHRAADGVEQLIEPKSGRIYSAQGQIEALIPSDLSGCKRRWSRPLWRLARHVASHVRLVFSGR